MARIRVEPNQLRAVSRDLQQASSQLHGLERRISGALVGLDWQVRSQANIDGRANAARGRANALAADADRLGRFLVDRAAAFEEADRQGVGGVGAVNDAYVAIQDDWLNGPAGPRVSYPGDQVERVLRLGQLAPGGLKSVVAVPIDLAKAIEAGIEVRDEDVDHALTDAARRIERIKNLREWAAIPAAFALNYLPRDGLVIVKGKAWVRELAGVAETLGRIYPQNLPDHLLKQAIGTGSFSAFISIVMQWCETIRDYRHEGGAKLLAALSVDAVLRGGISFVTGAAGSYLGGLLVYGVAALLGVTAAPAALVVAGGALGAIVAGHFGNIALKWLQDSGVRDRLIEGTTDVYRGIGETAEAVSRGATDLARSAAGAVDNTLDRAVSAIQNARLPALASAW